MTADSALITASPHAAPARRERVLFAIDSRDQALFFPDGRPGSLAARVEWPLRLPTRHETEAWRALLEAVRPDVLVSAWHTPPLPADWLADPRCPLRYVCHLSGSVRRQVPRVFLERGGLVTNWGTQASEQVAEHALFLALAAQRRVRDWIDLSRKEPVRPDVPTGIGSIATRTLIGRRVGIHGCGGVGRYLAGLLQTFVREIACYSAGVPDGVIRGAGMTPVHSLEELFEGREVLFECEALTEHNRGTVDAGILARLADGAVFVNVARAQLVEEAALMNEVRRGRLRVALDVMDAEPVPADSPWRALPGVIVSPHIAGPTLDRLPVIARHALNLLSGYLAGEIPTEAITLDQYDRAT